MVKFKVFFHLLTILFCSHTTCYSAKSTTKISNYTEDENNTIEVSLKEIDVFYEILYLEQNRLVLSLLEQNCFQNFTVESDSPHHLANAVVDYLLKYQMKSNEQKINDLASILLLPLGEYGSAKGENITLSQKMSVIHNWLKRSILGMSFVDWILEAVSFLKEKGSLTHGRLKRLFFKQLYDKNENGELSTEAMKYYRDHLIKEDMPSLLIHSTNQVDMERLQIMNLRDPEFGFLHVGLLVFDVGQLQFDEFTSLNEIKEIGIFLESLVRNGKTEFKNLFELPAKIYYQSTIEGASWPKIWDPYYEEYFVHLTKSNPLIQMMEPLNNWKNRSTLARFILKENGISEKCLTTYMSRDSEEYVSFLNNKDEKVTVPGIDNIFDEQNKNVSVNFKEMDKLLLTQVFKKIAEEDQKFIAAAKVQLVTEKFIVDFLATNVFLPVTKFSGSIPQFKPPIFLEDDNIDLLQCTLNNQERIYALDMYSYELLRVDRDGNKIMALYKRNYSLSNYELQLIPRSLIKKEDEGMETLVDNLSNMHSRKVYDALKINGYESTFWQELESFLWSLVPFYTCISEIKSDNLKEASIPCVIDIINFIPFIGQSIKVSYRFGLASVETSFNALRIASRQASIYQNLHQASKLLFINGVNSQIQKTMNKGVFVSLGRDFLQGADPGIGLLRLGGIQGIKVMKQASSYLKNKFYKLYELAEKLEKRADYMLTSPNHIRTEILNTKQKILLTDFNRKVTVVTIGREKGKDILVKIDEDSNTLYGRKYVLDSRTGNGVVAPITLRKKIYQIKTEGLSGRGAPVTGRIWAEESASLTATTRVNEVYRVDSRLPQELREAGGCRPRKPHGSWFRKAKYDYNLENHHTSVYEFRHTNSPFVSTTSSLSSAISFIKEWWWAWGHDPLHEGIAGYVYKIRPDSNFYNLRESYKVVRDVSPTDSLRYKKIDYIMEVAATMEEYVARDGFGFDRIIAYAPVPLGYDNPPLKWELNPLYDNKFDLDLSASDLYLQVCIDKYTDAMDMATFIIQKTLSVNKHDAIILIKKI